MNALVSQLFLSFILFQLVMLTVCYAEERICSSLASVYDSNIIVYYTVDLFPQKQGSCLWFCLVVVLSYTINNVVNKTGFSKHELLVTAYKPLDPWYSSVTA